MRRFFSHTLYWLSWSILLLSSVACSHQGEDDLQPNNYLSLALRVQDSQLMRQGTATAEETKIDNVMILFFETTGQQKLWKNKIYEYDATATGRTDKAKWEDGQTMLFPLNPEEVGLVSKLSCIPYRSLETSQRQPNRFTTNLPVKALR